MFFRCLKTLVRKQPKPSASSLEKASAFFIKKAPPGILHPKIEDIAKRIAQPELSTLAEQIGKAQPSKNKQPK